MERAARYLVEGARAVAGGKLLQGRRPFEGHAALDLIRERRTLAPCLAMLSERAVYRVPERAVKALLRWACGLDVEVRDDIPSAAHLLALQAAGRRSVSLLPEGVRPPSGESGFDFAVHDLCHLEKFAASPHYLEQVGFFSSLERAFSDPRWPEREAELDAPWQKDRDRVAADINGSSVYLFAVLKMKLKMAARRLHARRAGVVPPERGPLARAEIEAFEALEATLYDCFGWHGKLRAAARGTSARRDDPAAARRLAEEFSWRGRAALASRGGDGSAGVPDLARVVG